MTAAEPLPPIDKIVLPRLHDLGDGFTVRRALPTTERRMVGPSISCNIRSDDKNVT